MANCEWSDRTAIMKKNEIFERRDDGRVLRLKKARYISVLWLTSCKNMEQKDAETLVNDIAKKLPLHDMKYLMAVVRWVANGELDINNDSEVYKARKLLSVYLRSRLVKHEGNGDSLVFDGMCFKRLSVGKPASCLWTMKEVEEFLRPWN